MNRAYLDSLPEVRNKYGFQLEDGEKVVFTCKLAVFGTSQGAMLGGDNTVFALTNRRIMANNGRGIWCVSISDEDIAGQDELTVCSFSSKTLRLTVTAVLGRTHTFFMCKKLNI